MTPKISIITPCYNAVKHIEETILSIVSQDYSNLEYIIIDGGSTDGTVDIIKKYEDKITYWISEKDTGIYNAMNKGILAAKAEFCQFLNSGDYLADENVTQKMLAQCDDSSIIYGNMIKKWPYGKVFKNTSIDTKSFYNF